MVCGRQVEEEERLRIGMLVTRFMAVAEVRNAKTYNVGTESKVHGGETFERCPQALSLSLCVEGKGGGIKNDFTRYLE